MNTTVVDRLQTEFSDLVRFLDSAGEPSLRSVADDNLRKSLLMASASLFERRLTHDFLKFVAAATADNHVVECFVRNKAVSRQYHTWFDWDKKNANSFFGLFGERFREHMKTSVSNDSELKASIEAFLEVGRERNRLVHQDFGSFQLEKTTDEVYGLYLKAMKFVEWFPIAISDYAKVHSGNAAEQESEAPTTVSNATSG